VGVGVTDRVQTSAGFDADFRDEVLIPDIQDRQDASDAFGDDVAADAEAAATEEASITNGVSRRSTRESHPPERYQYFKMGGDPIVTKDAVEDINTADVLTMNASSVPTGLEESEKEEQLSWVNWIQGKADDWSVSLF